MFAQLGYYICVPFAWLTRLFYTWTGSYGVALILFTLIVKLVLLPFQLKSKKSMLRMGRMNSKVQEIQKKYANNKERQQQEIADLYAREGVNPMSGCLWSFLPFPILIALYYIIRTPLRYFMSLSNEVIAKITELAVSLGYVSGASGQASAYDQIYLAKFIHDNWSSFEGKFDGLIDLNYTFLSMDLSAVPKDLFSQFLRRLARHRHHAHAADLRRAAVPDDPHLHEDQRQQQHERLLQGDALYDAPDDGVDGLHPPRCPVRLLDRQRRLLLHSGAGAEQALL